jgi:hypothetical protein
VALLKSTQAAQAIEPESPQHKTTIRQAIFFMSPLYVNFKVKRGKPRVNHEVMSVEFELTNLSYPMKTPIFVKWS